LRIAIDTGGTFTDCVAMVDGQMRVVKVRSTPGDPGRAVMEGVGLLREGVGLVGGTAGLSTPPSAGSGFGRDDKALVGGALELRHGTTVGTNAMLERKGARVAFVTTAGFEDTIAIGRQTRPKLYAWSQPAAACLVAEGLRFGVAERVSSEGEILRRPSAAELVELVERVRASGAEAVAVSLLFAFLNAENEQRVVEALEGLGLPTARIPISAGHRILPEFREYERGSTLVVNAYLTPVMRGYLLGLEREVKARYKGGSVEVMQSSGGIVAAGLAAEEPVRTVLSGPAGGVIGAWEMARVAGFERVIGFDMGGTSTDVFLADAETGGVRRTNESVVAGVPVSVPMLDIHTAGAGGGSLARFDAGGLLRVGPESAGSVPGPVCFGRGELPTVTDANLLLGRLDEEQFMGGAVKLDARRARECFEERRGELGSVEAFAAGILRVVETQMERAIRVISVERGHDPRRFTLVAFGGGGPLHACAVARALRVPTVMVPTMPGALSAVGILLADAVRDYSRTVMMAGSRMGELEAEFRALEAIAAREGVGLRERACEPMSQKRDMGHPDSSTDSSTDSLPEYVVERSVDVRYVGQGYELNVAYGADAAERFHAMHEQRYGFANRGRGLEIVNVRVRVRVPSEVYVPSFEEVRAGDGAGALRGEKRVYFDGEWIVARVFDRERLHAGDVIEGPALVAEYTSATVVPPGARLVVDGLGNLVIDVGEASS
jgi:N-methylhydantoinase A